MCKKEFGRKSTVREANHGDLCGPTRKPAVPRVTARKPTPAQQAANVYARLKHLMLTEWPSIRSLNLGVKSGTGVVDQVLAVQLSELCTFLHMLAVSDAEAAGALVLLVEKLDEQHFQQLQVLLDTYGHEELSDYLRLLVRQPAASRSDHCTAKEPAAASSKAAGRGILIKSSAESADMASAVSSWNRPTAAGGDLQGTDLAFTRTHQTHAAHAKGVDGDGLRFASYLPPGHILIKTAEQLQRQNEFQAAINTARGTDSWAGRCVQQQGASQSQVSVVQLSKTGHGSTRHQAQLARFDEALLGRSASMMGLQSTSNLPHSQHYIRMNSRYQQHPLSTATPLQAQGYWRCDNLIERENCSPSGYWESGRYLDDRFPGCGLTSDMWQSQALCTPVFIAPTKSVERIWKDGRKATAEAIYSRAHLQVHDSAMNAVLLDQPVLLQPRLQPVAANTTASLGGKSTSRRCTMNSRPTSGVPGSRRATRLSNCDLKDFSSAGVSMVEASAELTAAITMVEAMASSSVAGSSGVGGGSSATQNIRWLVTVPEDDNSSCGDISMSAVVPGKSKRGIPMSMGSTARSNSAAVNCNINRQGSSALPAAVAAGVTNGDSSGPFQRSTNSLHSSSTGASAQASQVGATAHDVAGVSGSSAGAMSTSQLSLLKGLHPSASGGAAVGVLQLRPISAGADRSRPGSAASTSRLKASARGELW